MCVSSYSWIYQVCQHCFTKNICLSVPHYELQGRLADDMPLMILAHNYLPDITSLMAIQQVCMVHGLYHQSDIMTPIGFNNYRYLESPQLVNETHYIFTQLHNLVKIHMLLLLLPFL